MACRDLHFVFGDTVAPTDFVNASCNSVRISGSLYQLYLMLYARIAALLLIEQTGHTHLYHIQRHTVKLVPLFVWKLGEPYRLLSGCGTQQCCQGVGPDSILSFHLYRQQLSLVLDDEIQLQPRIVCLVVTYRILAAALHLQQDVAIQNFPYTLAHFSAHKNAVGQHFLRINRWREYYFLYKRGLRDFALDVLFANFAAVKSKDSPIHYII